MLSYFLSKKRHSMEKTRSFPSGRELKGLTPKINMKMFSVILKVTAFSWRRVLENSQTLKGILQRISLVVFFALTKEMCIAAHHFAIKMVKLYRKSGPLFVAIYCKHAGAALQTAYAGDINLPQPFPISLSRSGYPSIIPSYHRQVMRKKDDRADDLVKWYLSLFSLTKVIPLAKKVSKSTFKSIITPLDHQDEECVNNMANVIKEHLPAMIERYIPWVSTIPFNQGITWTPTWKALPNYKVFKMTGLPKSPYIYWTCELKCFATTLRFIHSYGEQFSPLCLWPPRIRFALDPRNEIQTTLDLCLCESSFAPLIPAAEEQIKQYYCFGRLGSSTEGRAKRRIFAIGNYICQRLLKPLHSFLMVVLRRLNSDGTFNQTRPLKYIVGRSRYYSYDLSAATDRMPLRILFYVMEQFFGTNFASAAVNSTLACHTFEIPFVRGRRSSENASPSVVSFVTGQPLGFLASWPLFALSHHFMVWVAAELVKPGLKFKDYALLGDDVVIADEVVALSYRRIMEGLKVEISDIKSLISSHACEFAKRFLVKGLRKDCSPVSMKNLFGSHHPMGVASLRMLYPDIPIKVLMRFHGAGYRTLARPMASRPRKYRRLEAILAKYLLPTTIWLGRGRPLNPYLKAAVILWLSERIKPRDLKLVPDQFIPDEDDIVINPNTGKPGKHDFNSRGFLEYSLLRGQMRLWLDYLKWYSVLIFKLESGCDLDLWIEEALNPPIVITDWKVSPTEPEIVRFGLQFKMYDYIEKFGLDWTPGILPEILPCRSCQSVSGSCGCPQTFRDLCSLNRNIVMGKGFILFLQSEES